MLPSTLAGSAAPRTILVVRRDNIGDLLCTTPLISALRQRFGSAWIGVLTNSYAAPVLDGNPDIDQVFAYDKGKHLDTTVARIGALARRARIIAQLRRRALDIAILPASGNQRSADRFARLSGAATVLRAGDIPVSGQHEVQRAFACAEALGIETPPPAMSLQPRQALVSALATNRPEGSGPLIGIHISARKPSQRWPIDKFAALCGALYHDRGARFLVFWAPGAADDVKHPGDDRNAALLLARLAQLPARGIETRSLAELIAALSLCDQVVCSDGGAMHIAAALGKPLVCLFGDSDASRWHPWRVPHEIMQPPSRNVIDVAVDDVVKAYARLTPE